MPGVEGVVDRGRARGAQPAERATHRGLVGRRVREPEDLLAEGHEPGFVRRPQAVEEGPARGPQRLDAVAGHAAAGVEHQHRLHGPRLGGEQLELLRHAVVAQHEVGGAQVGQRPAAPGHEHVDVDRLDLRAELDRLRRRLRGHRARDNREPHGQERPAAGAHFRDSRCSSSTSASRSAAFTTR